MYLYFIVSLAVCFAASALLGKFLIPVLKSKKLGQKILEIGPRWHASKEGTPTMGGIFFIIPCALVCILLSFIAFDKIPAPMLITLAMAVAFGMVGITDDLTKFAKKRNEGLTPPQKMVLQFAVAAAYLFAMAKIGAIDTKIGLVIINKEIELGFFYYVFSLFFIVGMVNSVNLTDGIDGLCAAVSAVVCSFFAILAFSRGDPAQAVFAGAVTGGLIGFLVFNMHPAKVFMGDTGSLFLGGAVTGLAYMSGCELIIMLAGIVYVCEIMSVVLQVSYFRLSGGKRLFKMAPIHHHFEKLGASENTIDISAFIITVIACIAAFLFIKY